MKNFVDVDIAPKSTLYLKFTDRNVDVGEENYLCAHC